MKTFLFLSLCFFVIALRTHAQATGTQAQAALTTDTLEGLAGSYHNPLDESVRFDIQREKDHLVLVVPGQGQTDMKGLGKDRFWPTGVNPRAVVAFVRDASGRAERFEWIQNHKHSNGEWICDSAAAAGRGGRYQLKNNPYKAFYIREEQGKLNCRLNAGPYFDLQPDAANKFHLNTGAYTIWFEFVPSGKGYKLLTHEGGNLDLFRFDNSAAENIDKGFPSDRTTFDRADSLRGMLTPLRTCYDVTFYGLDIAVDPPTQSIQGSATIRFRAAQSFTRLQLDLFANMRIEEIRFHGAPLTSTREYNAVFIDFPAPIPQGQQDEIKVVYSGKPQLPNVALLKGGFLWVKDKNGNPWIESVVQGSGASIWWPCKDHQSDKPDSMRISITVPAGLMDISNGRLLDSVALPGGRTRWDWYVDYPIVNYDVVVNIGRYMQLSDTLVRSEGNAGPGGNPDILPLHYYCLPYDLEKARRIFAVAKPLIRLYEKDFGPYPFPRDGFTLMESLYPMEHQSAVTFGSLIAVDDSPPDYPELTRVAWHETAHEWWGNSITCKDNADLWIHEAFATYAEVLAYGAFDGPAAAAKYLAAQQPKEKRTIIGAYGVNDFRLGYIYDRGCLLLNTFRHCLDNDSLFFAVLHGLQQRFRHQSVGTEDIVGYINEATGQNFTPIFDQYLRHTAPPHLQLMTRPDGDGLELSYRWKADVEGFAMPVRIATAKDRWSTIRPTNEWQRMHLAGMTPSDVQVDKEDFYVVVDWINP
jgi:hypothetical protein